MLRKTFRGLFALLLLVLEWTRPGLLSPLRPICDLRFLNHFIQEARDAEVAMKSCREGCDLSESVSVPKTSVNFDEWEKKDATEQAQEVQSGLWLLQQALNLLRTSMTNSDLTSHIDTTVGNLQSITNVLRSLNFQEYTPPASTVGMEGTWTVSSAAELLQVHHNFLRGKVHLLLKDAQPCKQDVS
ncbi:erythropoietin isoform X1 [Cyprinodon tularosa]|uniref:erythropoietin n=1 Tax=Cyprinodon variegatus TaxID=28743 RepID=UPI000742C1E1|nr:PREDICTED: erythropoietin [Cyprinodon variegatus]XP_038135039.1 erythropoietin isoform X1 [Cyprinodon tularosa]